MQKCYVQSTLMYFRVPREIGYKFSLGWPRLSIKQLLSRSIDKTMLLHQFRHNDISPTVVSHKRSKTNSRQVSLLGNIPPKKIIFKRTHIFGSQCTELNLLCTTLKHMLDWLKSGQLFNYVSNTIKNFAQSPTPTLMAFTGAMLRDPANSRQVSNLQSFGHNRK